MASEIKVETDELSASATTYRKEAESIKTTGDQILEKFHLLDNCWKGGFSKDFSSQTNALKKAVYDIYENSIKLSTFVEGAVKTYIEIDRGLKLRTDVDKADYPYNVTVSVHIKTQEELSKLYSEAIEIASKGVRNKGGGISCAGVTKAKMKLNGFEMDRIGNGNECYSNINSTDQFNADKYPGANCLYDLLNTKGQPITDIVVSFPYGASEENRRFGHVVYIDQIVDGKVYYSENYGEAKKGLVCSVEKFLSNYSSKKANGQTRNGEPIGCVHLTKKQ